MEILVTPSYPSRSCWHRSNSRQSNRGLLAALLLIWLSLGAIPAPRLFSQEIPSASRTANASGGAGASAADAVQPEQVQPEQVQPEQAQSELAGEPELPGETSDDVDPPGQAYPAYRQQDALGRQASSVQRQLGRSRRQRQGQGEGQGFFVSSWFSDTPVNPLATSAPLSDYDRPEDCEVLDNTIAEAFMRESATREGISLELVREVVRQESGFNPCAVSPKGAMGMMQLMPDTAKELGVADPFDPRENIDAGVRLLRRLLQKYQGRPDLALAAYNAGEGAVDKANGVPDYEETKHYVGTIMQKVFEAPPARTVRRPPGRNAPGRSSPGGSAPGNAPPDSQPPQPPEPIGAGRDTGVSPIPRSIQSPAPAPAAVP